MQKPISGKDCEDGCKQKSIDNKMQKLINQYPEVFLGIGKVKLDPIHVYRSDIDETTVAQKLRPVALYLMELLKIHLEEVVEGDVIKGPLGSELATG